MNPQRLGPVFAEPTFNGSINLGEAREPRQRAHTRVQYSQGAPPSERWHRQMTISPQTVSAAPHVTSPRKKLESVRPKGIPLPA